MKQKFKLKVILAFLFIIGPFLKGFTQIDDQSNGTYRKLYIKKSWQKLDKNKDGNYSEKEDSRSWKHLKHLDINKDKVISKEEFSKTKIPYINTGGERKLNVLYKETKENDLYLDIYYPKNKNVGQKLPVVIYTHGGGWAAGSRHGAANASFNTVHTALLEKGFCVVSVSYRLWKKGGKNKIKYWLKLSKESIR
jgi:hypothetical protein